MHPELDPAQVRRAVRFGGFVLSVLALLAFSLSILKPYTEYLWFSHDARHPEVFATAYGTRGWLLIGSFLLAWGILYGNLRRSFNQTLVYLDAPQSTGQAIIANSVQWVQRSGQKILWYGAPAFAFLSALGFSNEWDTFLKWRNAQPFGIKDPMYGIDLGFYVFTLPWYHAAVNWLFSLLLLTTVLTLGIYIGLQSLASLAKIELSRPGFRWHVSILIGTTIILFGLQNLLKTYEAGLIDSGQFTGAGYSMAQAVVATRIFSFLAILVGIVSILGGKVGKPYGIPMAGGIGLAAFYGLAVMAYPQLVQKLMVDPNRLVRESPYADRAIKMTRYAYGLDAIDLHDIGVENEPTAQDVKLAGSTFDNLRLWDPKVLRQSLQRQQSIRPYYSFSDIDIDRYKVGGKDTMLMIGTRDLDLDGLDAGARNWTNERLRYTHGYGITLSRVNDATADGQPEFLARDIPQESTPELKIDQPRIYFGDHRDPDGSFANEYAIVNTVEPELDFQTPSTSQTHKWEGDRGIPIGGFLARLAFGVTLGDGNLIVSGNVGGQSRLLIRRNIIERSTALFPFLRFDQDPYLVLLNGRPIWVVDGYTTTDMIPYADRVVTDRGAMNYIRNSVKITVDAYTGETNAYAIEPDEPILRAYRKVYPGLVQDISAAPKGLDAHWRYPEDLFTIQCVRLTAYHVTDPVAFLSNSDAWDIAAERDLGGNKAPILPYYVQMRLPDEKEAGFMQILPFTPRGRQTMSGWIAAHCDPGQYGKLTMYRFTSGDPMPGPELMEANFVSTPEISNINRQYNNEQSEIVVGNLVVVPVGKSLMYAESLFLRSKATGIEAAPRLFRVILSVSDRIVVGENYADALQKLFGAGQPSPVTPPASGGTTPTPRTQSTPAQAAARDALQTLQKADEALRKGDFAGYGELQKVLKKKLETLAK